MDNNDIPEFNKPRLFSARLDHPRPYRISTPKSNKLILNELEKEHKIKEIMKNLNIPTTPSVTELQKPKIRYGLTANALSNRRTKLPKINRGKFTIDVTVKKSENELSDCFGSPALWLKKMKDEKSNNILDDNENKVIPQNTFKPLILSNKFNSCNMKYYLKSNKNPPNSNVNNSQNSQGGNANNSNTNNSNVNSSGINNSNINTTNIGLAEIDEQIVNNHLLIFRILIIIVQLISKMKKEKILL
ncbi:MAG: hypothetical protein MJ252_09780 [archaeon]|nr:hypothetical protein [archaeon]